MKINKKRVNLIIAVLISIISTNYVYPHITAVSVINNRNKPMMVDINYYSTRFHLGAAFWGSPDVDFYESKREEIPARSTKSVTMGSNTTITTVSVWSPRGAGAYWGRKIDLTGAEEGYARTKHEYAPAPYILEITISDKPYHAVMGIGVGETFDIEHRFISQF